MQLALMQAIAQYVNEQDPNGDVVSRIEPSDENWKQGKVYYNWSNISKGRDCGQWDNNSQNGAEELVRAYLLVRLVKELGYPVKALTVEESYSIGRASSKAAYLDVRVADLRDPKQEKSFLLIECKAPEKYASERTAAIENQLFRLAPLENTFHNRPVRYLAYYTIRWVTGDTPEKGTIREDIELIDFEQYQNWTTWDGANQPVASRIIPASYDMAVSSVYVNGTPGELQDGQMLLDKSKERDFFQRLRIDLHNKLWGGSTEYNYVFKNLSRLFLAKIFDEITTLPGKSYRFQAEQYTDPVTGKAFKESPQHLFERINKLVRESAALLGYTNGNGTGNFGIEEDYIDANKVAYVVNRLEDISVTENIHARTGDILGDFFEGIISEGYKQDRGTFFTHKNIVYFILYGLCLDALVKELATDSVSPRLPFICDPACGSGTFLIESMRFVTRFLPATIGQVQRVRQALSTWTTSETPHAWADRFIYGIDDNPDLALSTKVNMVLHLDGSIHIFRGDALQPFTRFPETPTTKNIPSLLRLSTRGDQSAPYPYEVNEQFDVVLSNPPFSVPLNPDTKKDHRGRFLFAEASNSEVLFLERYYQLLRANGRMGVVLPESIFDTAENLPVRLFLYRHFEIWGIVSLPSSAFRPFTNTKTCLLFARKKTRDEVVKFDDEWKKVAAEYRPLRRHPLNRWAVENRKLHRLLMNLCIKYDFSYQPLHNLLQPDMVDVETIPNELKEAAQRSSGISGAKFEELSKSIDALFKEIDDHFAEAPFPHIRIQSKRWKTENQQLLTAMKEFALSVGTTFEGDNDGQFSEESFTEEAKKRLEDAARVTDEAEVRKTQKQQKLWTSLREKGENYITRYVKYDANLDPEARRVLQRFLKSLLEANDASLPLLILVDKYLDDISAVSELNDNFGKFPDQERVQPRFFVNAWWVFGEVTKNPDLNFPIFLAEAEEIGYKKGKGNRYQERPNQLFHCTNPKDLLTTIDPDAPNTILGGLRSHVCNAQRARGI